MGGWVGGPCTGGVGGGRGVDVAVGVKVGVLVGVGGMGVRVAGNGVQVGEGVAVGVEVGLDMAVDVPGTVPRVGVEPVTEAPTFGTGSASLIKMAIRTPATKARARNSNEPLLILWLSVSFNSSRLRFLIPLLPTYGRCALSRLEGQTLTRRSF
jgi:hypothetical protein